MAEQSRAADAASSIVRMRAGALLAADDAVWAQFADAAERLGLDSDHTAPGRLLASAPSWIAARRVLLQARARGPATVCVLDRAGISAVKSRDGSAERHIPGFVAAAGRAAASATADAERFQAAVDEASESKAAESPKRGARGRGRVGGAAARRRKQAADAASALADLRSAPAVPLIKQLPASPALPADGTTATGATEAAEATVAAETAGAVADDGAAPAPAPSAPSSSYAAVRRVLLGRRYGRLRRWAEDTALQRMAAEAMQRALRAERDEVGKWVESDAEDSSSDEEEGEDDDDGENEPAAALPVPGRAAGRARAGSVASRATSVSGTSRARLRGKALRLGIPAELRAWERVARLDAGDGPGAGGGDAGAGAGGGAEGLSLPPPPSAMRAADDGGSAGGRGGGGSAGPPLPSPVSRACTALAFCPGPSTDAASLVPPPGADASSWAPPRGPGGGDVLAAARAAHDGDGHSVELAEAVSGRLFASLRGHTAPVTSLAWDATGSYLLSCGLDSQVRLWAVSPPRYSFDARAIGAAMERRGAAGGGGDGAASLRESLRPALSGGGGRCVRLLVRDTPVTHGAFFPTSSNLFLVARATPRRTTFFAAAARAMGAPAPSSAPSSSSSSAGGGSAAWQGCIEVINASTGHTVQRVETDDVITGLCFARSGTALFWADVRGRLRCLDVGVGGAGGGGGGASAAGGGGRATSAAAIASGATTTGAQPLLEASQRVIFDQRAADRAAVSAARAAAAARAGRAGPVSGAAAVAAGAAEHGAWSRGGGFGAQGGAGAGSRARAPSGAESGGRSRRGSLAGSRAMSEGSDAGRWAGCSERAGGLAFGNDSDAGSVAPSAADDAASVASWGAAPGGPAGNRHGSASLGASLGRRYLVRLEHRPYDTMLRCPALLAVDACGNRRAMALCGAGAGLAVLERCREASLAVLALGGAAAAEPGAAAAAAELHPSRAAAEREQRRAAAERAAAEAGTDGAPRPVIKPWQMGGRRKESLVPGTSAAEPPAVPGGSPSRGGFGLFGRRRAAGAAPGAGAGSSGGVRGVVEVSGARARKADALVVGPVGSASASGAGSDVVLVGGPDGDAAVVDPYAKTAAGSVVARLRGHVRGVTAVAWAGDDGRLATGDEGGAVVLWEHPMDEPGGDA